MEILLNLMWLFEGLNAQIHGKYSEQCLAHSKCTINISYHHLALSFFKKVKHTEIHKIYAKHVQYRFVSSLD